MAMLAVGEKAPQFTLPDKNENLVNLSDFSGKWVVLYFYPKDNTPGCTTEAKDFTELNKKFTAADAVIIGVSPDKPASHARFIEKQDLHLLLLSDMNHEILEKYGAWQLKNMYGREFMGVARSTFLIDKKGNVAAVWEKVKVKEHAQKVLDKLLELENAQ
jgi:peroxiredoxin Q/BCP